MDSDTAMCQFLGSPEQILCVAFAAKGEGVGMLEQKQGWRTRPSRALASATSHTRSPSGDRIGMTTSTSPSTIRESGSANRR